MQLVKRAVGTKKNLTLSEACSLYGLEAGNHRANRDVLATWLLLRVLGTRAVPKGGADRGENRDSKSKQSALD
jgi:hypothetical protein